ncbi:MAG: hypothetical protein U1E62_20115 [Alsobacter sp.]
MAGLPVHIARALLDADEASLEDVAEMVIGGQCGILFSEASKDALASCCTEADLGDVLLSPLREPTSDWRYREVLLDGVRVAQLAQIPSSSAGAPPTSIESMLIRAWVAKPEVCPGPEFQRVSNCLVTIVEHDPPVSQEIVNLMIASFNGVRAVHPIRLILDDAQTLSLSSAFTSNAEVTRRRIMLQAVSENSAASRFQALYRIHENCYLSSVFARIQANFFLEPVSTLESAQKELLAERSALIGLIQDRGLLFHFENALSAAESLVDSNNRFAYAIQREIKRRQDAPFKEEWKRGAAWIYQIRCSVVHSGTGVIYENFDDADLVLARVLPHLERSAMSLIGVGLG